MLVRRIEIWSGINQELGGLAIHMFTSGQATTIVVISRLVMPRLPTASPSYLKHFMAYSTPRYKVSCVFEILFTLQVCYSLEQLRSN